MMKFSSLETNTIPTGEINEDFYKTFLRLQQQKLSGEVESDQIYDYYEKHARAIDSFKWKYAASSDSGSSDDEVEKLHIRALEEGQGSNDTMVVEVEPNTNIGSINPNPELIMRDPNFVFGGTSPYTPKFREERQKDWIKLHSSQQGIHHDKRYLSDGLIFNLENVRHKLIGEYISNWTQKDKGWLISSMLTLLRKDLFTMPPATGNVIALLGCETLKC
ncbi:hypothetical protein M6B38_366950 [Iris pallida]|uniref:Uncharacterized protein n=1 Tax=Iris pallida TaxID=29817 RepID=A0AAX6FUH0_IRIPA|nr:hypothetical protein M6B38_400775 [Iris pallida]KAJ6827618.1 hypothetical protein M6B38_366950 [Iris pallida]